MNTLTVVVTHTPLASALKDVALHVFPAAKDMLVYDILPTDDPDVIQAKIMDDIMSQYSSVQNILLFSDLIGATPSNISMRIAQALHQQGKQTAFFGGTNVCMLLNAVRYADLSIEELRTKILEGGQKGMQSLDCSCH
ncbi:MAG: hypothetical protein SOX43_06655 [Pelistega sp.]|nr:hypothetical protein [Pelistega sp.]